MAQLGQSRNVFALADRVAVDQMNCVPKRFRLSDVDIIMTMMKYERMTKRELAKYLYQTWTALGANVRRGKLYPPIGTGKQVLTMLYEIVSGKYDEAAKGKWLRVSLSDFGSL